MPISILYNGNPINGTAEDDFIFGIPGTAGTNANTINGNAGDDFILADISSAWFAAGSLSNSTFATAMSIDNFNVWTLDENPLIENATTIPHTTVTVEATAAQGEIFSFTAVAGQEITIDVDFGIATALANIGVSTDVKILLVFEDLVVAENVDESATLADPLLRYTANASGTYYIVVQPDDVSVFAGGETFILNLSVTGHALGAPTVMGDDVIDGGDGDDYIAGVGGNDTVHGGLGNDTIEAGSGNDFLYGDDGLDRLFGGDGDDRLEAGAGAANLLDGGSGNDILVGGDGADILVGSDGDDVLTGGVGDDSLTGGAGIDVVDPGEGNDRVTIAFDVETIDGGAGYDELRFMPTDDRDVSFNLVTGASSFGASLLGFEAFSLVAPTNGIITLVGTADNNNIFIPVGKSLINAGDGDDYIYASTAALVVDGGNGFDTINFLNSSGVTVLLPFHMMSSGGFTCYSVFGIEGISGSNGNDTVVGGDEDNVFEGLAGDDVLAGGGGNDLLDGEAGIDATNGGGGDDTHIVDNALDVVIERAGEGFDRVTASVSFSLSAGAEVELLATSSQTGTGAISLTGNELAQSIHGNDGANIITGGGGMDTLFGFGGADTLKGGIGIDRTEGGAGDDWHFVDDSADIVIELSGEGNDRVLASVSYTLAAGTGIEVLSTASNSGTDAIDLTGNELANALIGNAGVNVLDGGGGIDDMSGLGGNDWYFVDNAADIVAENADPLIGGASDRVFARVSYALAGGRGIEILSTASNSGTTAINLTGNELANALIGNAGVNVLDGGGGIDNMSGLGGNDFYFVDHAGDIVGENADPLIGGTSDRVFARVSYTLAAGTGIEVLSTASNSGTGAIDLTGNAFANALIGNNGANVLNGKAGKDAVNGLGGADIFVFDTALNTAPGSAWAALASTANVDNLSDFDVAADTIHLDNAVFVGLGLGALAAGAFNTGAAATDVDDRILYDPATGALIFDPDGSAGSATVFQFAVVAPGLAITASDFVVI